MNKRLHLKIYGRVQGVGFRWSAAKQARVLGLYGWVRNCEEGCVETAVEGDEGAMEKYRVWCKKGPMFAKVESMEEEWGEYTGVHATFEMR